MLKLYNSKLQCINFLVIYYMNEIRYSAYLQKLEIKNIENLKLKK